MMRERFARLLGYLRTELPSEIESYRLQRKTVGWLGIALPFVCVLGALIFDKRVVYGSISYYYHSNVRDFFVALMGSVALFLFCYRGRARIDNFVSTLAAVFGSMLTFFPCRFDKTEDLRIGIFNLPQQLSDKFHIAGAIPFFIMLALNSLFIFTITWQDGRDPGPRKRRRNLIYRICGAVMLLGVASVIVLYCLLGDRLDQTYWVLGIEAVMLWAFGFSWLVKGDAVPLVGRFLRDLPETMEAPIDPDTLM